MEKVYNMHKGKHYSGLHISPFFNKKEYGASVVFKENCSYDIGFPDQLDVNKLFGLSFGYHHKNSVRFGWRYNTSNSKIEIIPYAYVDGIRIISDVLLNVDLNQEVFLGIEVLDKEYLYIAYVEGGEHHECRIAKPSKLCSFGYKLFPYFGGNQVAPHTMTIHIND